MESRCAGQREPPPAAPAGPRTAFEQDPARDHREGERCPSKHGGEIITRRSATRYHSTRFGGEVFPDSIQIEKSFVAPDGVTARTPWRPGGSATFPTGVGP